MSRPTILLCHTTMFIGEKRILRKMKDRDEHPHFTTEVSFYPFIFIRSASRNCCVRDIKLYRSTGGMMRKFR